MSLLDYAARRRAAEFFASGEDPFGYMVSAKKLREVVRSVADVSDATKERFISDSDSNLIQGSELVDSFELGLFIEACVAEYDDKVGLVKILTDLKDTHKLPFVEVRGEKMH